MSPINTTRVILGGLVAGLIINISEFILNVKVVGADMAAQMAKLGLPVIGGHAVAVFVVFGFAIGLAAIWLYAAVRPRLGPGPKAATLVAATVWFFGYLYGSVGMTMMGFFPMGMMVLTTVWGLVEVLVAVNVGAWLYRE